DGDRIASAGDTAGTGRREVDARGLIVAPGWVDIHTHYDGQATWDPYLTPSSWHGVTTVVMGNCGVGFAPARPDRHDWLIGLMEGVEDIPGTALAEGIRWQWERFPEYLDALETMPRALDVGAQVPHPAVRAYVSAARAASRRTRTTSPAGPGSCGRGSRPARSASPPHARSSIAPSTASRSPARSRRRTSSSASAVCSASSAAASSSWRQISCPR